MQKLSCRTSALWVGMAARILDLIFVNVVGEWERPLVIESFVLALSRYHGGRCVNFFLCVF